MSHEEYESKSQMKRVEILKAEEKQMTHEELLAKITNGNISYKAENKALRAVVELHKPEGPNVQPLTRCVKCMTTYPCEEIRTIEKELK